MQPHHIVLIIFSHITLSTWFYIIQGTAWIALRVSKHEMCTSTHDSSTQSKMLSRVSPKDAPTSPHDTLRKTARILAGNRAQPSHCRKHSQEVPLITLRVGHRAACAPCKHHHQSRWDGQDGGSSGNSSATTKKICLLFFKESVPFFFFFWNLDFNIKTSPEYSNHLLLNSWMNSCIRFCRFSPPALSSLWLLHTASSAPGAQTAPPCFHPLKHFYILFNLCKSNLLF